MMKGHSHLTDDQLLELCLSAGGAQPCAACEARRVQLASLLEETSAAATVEADAAFPADRLARQQSRILHRIEQDGRPGRVIAFPNHGYEMTPLRARPAARWIAGAAAAGLVIGLLAGHLAHDLPASTVAAVPPATAAGIAPALETPAPALRAVATTFSEEEFLGQIEMAADSPGGTALRPLHDLTPRAWD